MMPFEEKVWGNNRKRLFVCEWFFFSFSSVFLFFFSSSSNWDVPFERNEASCGACRRSSASAGLLCGRGFHFSFVIFFLALERFSHSFLVVGSCFGVGVVILDLLPPNCCQWKTGNSFALVLSSFESKTKVWFVIIFVISREKKKRRLG